MFTEKVRCKYDLESLWGIGGELEINDDEPNDDLAILEDMISRSSDILADIEPLEESIPHKHSYRSNNPN